MRLTFPLRKLMNPATDVLTIKFVFLTNYRHMRFIQ